MPTPNYGSWPPLDEVEIELGSVDYKYLHNPIQVKFCGTVRTYYESGRGAYPYPCNAQDKHPDSMIYTDPIAGTWFPSHDLVNQGDYYTLKGW